MRWQAPSERTQMWLLSPVLIVLLPPMLIAVGAAVLADKIRQFLAPSREWHDWFAWRPVRHYNSVDWLWLETVERRWHGNGCFYQFKEPRP